MKLIEIWQADLEKAYYLQNSFEQDETGFVNRAFGYSFDEFCKYVNECELHSYGQNLPEGYVPDTIYILENDEGDYVGIFNLRHFLNEFLENGPGHIGYGISKEYRKYGYGTKGLGLTLEKARNLGITEAYLSCYKSNEGSLKVQLNNGGVIHHEDEKYYYTRIKLI